MNIDASNTENLTVDAGPGNDTINITASDTAGPLTANGFGIDVQIAGSSDQTGIAFASLTLPAGNWRLHTDQGGTFKFGGGNGAQTGVIQLRIVTNPRDEADLFARSPAAQFQAWDNLVQGGTVHADAPIPAWQTETVITTAGSDTVVAALSMSAPVPEGAVASGTIQLVAIPA